MLLPQLPEEHLLCTLGYADLKFFGQDIYRLRILRRWYNAAWQILVSRDPTPRDAGSKTQASWRTLIVGGERVIRGRVNRDKWAIEEKLPGVHSSGAFQTEGWGQLRPRNIKRQK
ncbi:hypothetical protein GGR58DRAFT_501200 [Xylaria digitata]|nr:hypothetical protein GGR58DRAFT_501200 [Xylaria digitata]